MDGGINGGSIYGYRQEPLLAEGVLSSYKPNTNVTTKRSEVTGKDHPFDAEYNFLSRFPLGFNGCFICGATNHFNRMDCPKGIKTREERRIFFNEMWAHKPHTKKRLRDGSNVSSIMHNLRIIELAKPIRFYIVCCITYDLRRIML